MCGILTLEKINTNCRSNIFFENVTQSGFFPKITMPTRLANITLIDNIFTNNIDHTHTSGVLAKKQSDHQICFTMLNNKRQYESNKYKYIEIEKSDIQSFERFQYNLCQENIYERLDKDILSDPNENCNLLINTITELKSIYMPRKRVKFNKRKHKEKPWLTNQLLKQINKKTDLYAKLKRTNITDRKYNTMKRKFKEHELKVKRDIIHAKREYYYRVFTLHKNNMKKTWLTIKETLNKFNMTELPNKIIHEDKTFDNEQDIADQFNIYFANVGSNLSAKINTATLPITYADYLSSNIETLFICTPVHEQLILLIKTVADIIKLFIRT